MVFLVRINSSGGFQLRGALHDPTGKQRQAFRQAFSTNPQLVGRRYTRTFKMATLKGQPGEWQVHLFIDDQPIGTYAFVVKKAP